MKTKNNIKSLIMLALTLITIAVGVGTTNVTADASSHHINGKKVAKYAKKFIGRPYVWGASSKYAFDCSGLVTYVYKHAAGVKLAHSSRTQARQTKRIKLSSVKAGDLLFWSRRGVVYHVAIATSKNSYVNALAPGYGVRMGGMGSRPNFATRVR
ncbi:C40 family peptidase [Periweissella beninensis]|uniref:C40 family peptidase n=1 Tax=Periweissella beninensis TaxID=504936 RepID=A0ABT0VHZ9_9LACO|nr:C40 family peptidase [Periweissella beninensis]MBM7544165.1 cell wall-associated NlpC family hydrolase [Periweissella beninensis]MCM2437462.1 C40 family peptidase [Periweissella beninensis]MCT4396687.1 peptidoglycan endopeptidase [Periweissella beninensis]